ncbi:MAG: hypothetical protein KC766_40875 [Myxococcales bacterium]|nr:hypothetical protein [Myxococcales bacterium]
MGIRMGFIIANIAGCTKARAGRRRDLAPGADRVPRNVGSELPRRSSPPDPRALTLPLEQ